MDSKNEDEYRSAESFNYTWRLRLTFFWHYLRVNFMILLLFVPETLKGIKNFVLPPKPKDISGQVVIVTGAGNGLGRAIAFRLAQEKCKLAIVDIDFAAAQQTADDIKRKFNVSAIAFKVDVSRHQEIEKLKEEVESTLGFVDILVNNAGLLCMEMSLREGTNEQIQKAVDVNLLSHFWAARTFLRGMVERKRGHVVAICSFAGKLTFPGAVTYCATKFGVTGFMSALFDELCLFDQDFIQTTTVYPTFINTRKELSDFLDKSGGIPRFEPNYAAHMIVKGIVRNQRSIYIPRAARHSLALNWCPDRIIKYAKINAVDSSKLKQERLLRLPGNSNSAAV